jgi:predicted nuclease of predicted toxin-antitoxin system
MPGAILDESVSLLVAETLRSLGFETLVVAHQPDRGMADEGVFELAATGGRLLVTRDAHFTNPLRFPADRTGGILYIARGNLLARQEADLVEDFLKAHEPEDYRGRLVSLTLSGPRIR